MYIVMPSMFFIAMSWTVLRVGCFMEGAVSTAGGKAQSAGDNGKNMVVNTTTGGATGGVGGAVKGAAKSAK